MATLGAEARPSTPEELAAYLAEAQKHWADIVATAHVTIE
jgi:hypothetical protein